MSRTNTLDLADAIADAKRYRKDLNEARSEMFKHTKAALAIWEERDAAEAAAFKTKEHHLEQQLTGYHHFLDRVVNALETIQRRRQETRKSVQKTWHD